MKTTVNGLAMIILPPNISVGEAEILFSEVLKKLRLESAKISTINANNEAFASILMLMTYSSQVKLEYYLQIIC